MLNFIHPSVYIMIDEVIHGGEWRVESICQGRLFCSAHSMLRCARVASPPLCYGVCQVAQ
jgi:hypothetical protein